MRASCVEIRLGDMKNDNRASVMFQSCVNHALGAGVVFHVPFPNVKYETVAQNPNLLHEARSINTWKPSLRISGHFHNH